MVSPHFQTDFGSRQRGAALAVGLIILVVMTLLAVSMSQSTRLQERISGNSRDMNVALQGLESALRAGEAKLAETGGNVLICNSGTGCEAKTYNYFHNSGVDLSTQELGSWWAANGWEFGTAAVKDIPQAANDPFYVIEERGFEPIGGSLVQGEPPHGRSFFSITAHANGISDSTHLVATSVFVVVQ